MRLRRVELSMVFLTLLSIFRIPRSWLQIKFRNERQAKDFAHVWIQSLRWSSICTQLSQCSFFSLLFYFLCNQEISSLVVSFSEHCAQRKKTEEARKTVAKRAATNGFSFFGFFFFFSPKNGKSFLLLYHCARFNSNCYCVVWLFACWPIVLI